MTARTQNRFASLPMLWRLAGTYSLPMLWRFAGTYSLPMLWRFAGTYSLPMLWRKVRFRTREFRPDFLIDESKR